MVGAWHLTPTHLEEKESEAKRAQGRAEHLSAWTQVMVENVLQARSRQAIVQQRLGSHAALPAAWWKAHTGLSPARLLAPEH